MAVWFTAFRASWRQAYKLAVSYMFNLVSSIITMCVVFLLMFYGVKAVGAGALSLGDTLGGLFTGYIAWMIAIIGYQDLAYNVTNEAQTGTLEQLYITPVGYKCLAFFTQTFNAILNLSVVLTVTAIMMLFTGQRLNLDILSLLPVFIAIYVQACGLGFALAGLALIFKRIQSVFQIVTFGVVGLFAVPWDVFPWAKYLPFTMGQHVMKKVMMENVRLAAVPFCDLGVLAVATVLYLAVGLGLFTLAENKAKSSGLLGQY